MSSGYFFVHAAVFLFGLSGVLAKVSGLSPSVLVFTRTAISSLFFIFFARRQNVSKPHFFLLIFSGIMLASHWYSFFYAIEKVGLSMGLILFSTFPIFTSFLEPVILKEKMKKQYIISSLIAVFGTSILFFRQGEFNFSLDYFIGIFSGFSFSILAILNKNLGQKIEHSALLAIQFVTASLFILAFYFSTIIKHSYSLRDIFYILIISIFCTTVAHSLFLKSILILSASKVSIFTTLEPIYGILFGFFFFNEKITYQIVLGGALIFIATTYISIRKTGKAISKGKIHDAK